MKYCSECGGSVSYREVTGEDRPRHVCDACGMVFYQNRRPDYVEAFFNVINWDKVNEHYSAALG